jgi:hypothetical protein
VQAMPQLSLICFGARAAPFQPPVNKNVGVMHPVCVSFCQGISHSPLCLAPSSRGQLISCRHTQYPAIPPSSQAADRPLLHHRCGHTHGSSQPGIDSGTDSGVHVHHGKGEAWGPLRTGLYHFLERTQLLAISDFLSHSFRSALASAACFLGYAFLSTRAAPSMALPPFTIATSTPALVLLTISLAFSGIPCLVDAVVQVSCHSVQVITSFQASHLAIMGVGDL